MKKLVFSSILSVVAMLPACSKAPSSPSVSFTSPMAAVPSNGTVYKFNAQPVTLAITNAVRTSPATATYNLEVASDAGFANKVFTRDGVPEGNGSTTSVQLSALGGGATYFWRWKTVIDGVIGQPSPTQSFVVQQQIIINQPTVSDVPNETTSTTARPTFTTRNASRSGPVSALFYEFQVSTTSNFASVLTGATVPEQSGQTTSWTPTADLPTQTLFWRVRALDPSNSETSSFSSVTTVVIQPFSLKDATIYNNPPDFKNWAETATITLVDFSQGRVVVDFDKRTSSPRWPDVGFGDGDLQYTLGMCLNINKQWSCSAAIQFWFGRELENGGDVGGIGQDWFYDPRWGVMSGYQPRFGELVGIYVAAGNLRDSGNVILKERSNILLIPYGQNYRK